SAADAPTAIASWPMQLCAVPATAPLWKSSLVRSSNRLILYSWRKSSLSSATSVSLRTDTRRGYIADGGLTPSVRASPLRARRLPLLEILGTRGAATGSGTCQLPRNACGARGTYAVDRVAEDHTDKPSRRSTPQTVRAT